VGTLKIDCGTHTLFHAEFRLWYHEVILVYRYVTELVRFTVYSATLAVRAPRTGFVIKFLIYMMSPK
jgi:hypothetical protein